MIDSNEIIKKAKQRKSSRHYVSFAVDLHWPTISTALANGLSQWEIYSELKALKVNVGSKSGFNYAINRKKKNQNKVFIPFAYVNRADIMCYAKL